MEHRIPKQYGGALYAIDQNYQLPEPEKLGVIYLFDGNNLSLHPNSEPNMKKLHTFLEKYTKSLKNKSYQLAVLKYKFST